MNRKLLFILCFLLVLSFTSQSLIFVNADVVNSGIDEITTSTNNYEYPELFGNASNPTPLTFGKNNVSVNGSESNYWYSYNFSNQLWEQIYVIGWYDLHINVYDKNYYKIREGEYINYTRYVYMGKETGLHYIEINPNRYGVNDLVIEINSTTSPNPLVSVPNDPELLQFDSYEILSESYYIKWFQYNFSKDQLYAFSLNNSYFDYHPSFSFELYRVDHVKLDLNQFTSLKHLEIIFGELSGIHYIRLSAREFSMKFKFGDLSVLIGSYPIYFNYSHLLQESNSYQFELNNLYIGSPYYNLRTKQKANDKSLQGSSIRPDQFRTKIHQVLNINFTIMMDTPVVNIFSREKSWSRAFQLKINNTIIPDTIDYLSNYPYVLGNPLIFPTSITLSNNKIQQLKDFYTTGIIENSNFPEYNWAHYNLSTGLLLSQAVNMGGYYSFYESIIKQKGVEEDPVSISINYSNLLTNNQLIIWNVEEHYFESSNGKIEVTQDYFPHGSTIKLTLNDDFGDFRFFNGLGFSFIEDSFDLEITPSQTGIDTEIYMNTLVLPTDLSLSNGTSLNYLEYRADNDNRISIEEGYFIKSYVGTKMKYHIDTGLLVEYEVNTDQEYVLVKLVDNSIFTISSSSSQDDDRFSLSIPSWTFGLTIILVVIVYRVKFRH